MISGRYFPHFLAVIAAIWTAYLINRYAIEIPFQDDWSFVPRYLALKNGTLSLSHLTAQHNEHRIFVTLGIMLLNAAIFDWNMKLNLYLAVALELAAAIVLIELAYRTVSGWLPALACGILIAIQIFNMSQFVNWLWEWCLGWHILNFCTACAFACLHAAETAKQAQRYIAAAIVFAFTASFSIAVGLVIWPVGAIYLTLVPPLRKFIPVWLIFATLAAALYFFGSHVIARPAKVALTLTVTAEFLFRYLGSTVWSGPAIGAAVLLVA